MDLTAFADEVGVEGAVTITGLRTRGGAVPGVRCVHAPAGIDWLQADEMTVCCGAGTPVDELQSALAAVGQRVALPPGGSVGGALAVGRAGVRRLGDGPVRDAVLQARYVSSAGDVVKAGGPTVKNVSGFDLCRLLVGSHGTLGFVGEVILRTRPIAPVSRWFTIETGDPMAVFIALHRPVSVLWDGRTVHVLLEGHRLDVEEQAARLGLAPAEDAPVVPPARRLVAPSQTLAEVAALTPGDVVAELGLGILHVQADSSESHVAPVPEPGVASIEARVKAQFDPTGRLNPGRTARG
ncbi:MAG: FAD-binding protein [Actinomycetes bacterium]